MINVLITSFGSNTSIGVAKCLKDDGCFIIGTDSNPFYECNGFKFANIIEQLPYYNDPLYEEELLRIVKDYNVNCTSSKQMIHFKLKIKRAFYL